MIEHHVEEKAPITLTERLRILFRQPLDRIGSYIHSIGVKPNWITYFGFLGSIIGSLFVSQGMLTIGGAIILFMGPVDALDGAVARAGNEVTKFGAFIDSVIDRFIEVVIYSALVWYFITEENGLGVVLTFFALSGSVLVSYTRARAQSLGLETKVGILTRLERMMVIGPAILLQIPFIGVAIVAFLANISALQRIAHVKQQTDGEVIVAE